MVHRIATQFMSSLIPMLSRMGALILCAVLAIPVTWQDIKPSSIGHVTFAQHSDSRPSTLEQQSLPHTGLPAHLTTAPTIPSVSALQNGRQLTQNARTKNAVSHEMWAALLAVPQLPSPRIDPVAWNIDAHSARLQSERGPIFFARPPPAALS